MVNDNNDTNFITDLKDIQSSNTLTLRNTYFITHTIGGTNMAAYLQLVYIGSFTSDVRKPTKEARC